MRIRDELRRLNGWLRGNEEGRAQGEPTTNDRRLRNRRRCRRTERALRWQQRHRKLYRQKMKRYMRTRREGALALG